MTKKQPRLSARTIAILEMIASGHSYEQIIVSVPGATYLSIFDAARNVLEIAREREGSAAARLEAVRRSHPRAYEPWTVEEESKLLRFHGEGLSLAEIAAKLQRQRSAIASRLARLEAVSEEVPF